MSLILFFVVLATGGVYSEEPQKTGPPNKTDDAGIAKTDEGKKNSETEIYETSKNVQNWTVPNQNEVRREIENWLKSSNFADASVQQNILLLWEVFADESARENNFLPENESDVKPEPKNTQVEEHAPNAESKSTDAELFGRTIESMRMASKHVAEYLRNCDEIAWQELPYGQKLVVPQIPLHIHLGESSSTQYLYNSLQMYVVLKLVQGRYYSEAETLFADIKPENCVNPAEFFIVKAIIYNGLSQHKEGTEALKDFRAAEKLDTVSRRYVELAKLLEFEMKDGKEDDSPQNIAKKMDNARRILGKGDTGKEAQETEDDILKSLEKLIEKVEEQAKKSKSEGEGEKSDSLQSNDPAKESEILGGKAPGNVDRKDFDQNGGWGNMPPKDREAALSKIEREFPAHYRDIIESYFREMASGDKP
ncbi:MAG: hypothetical protein LBJ00_18030 [Planctomycetaceae bacterium]|nr:hypothetical protein [Planctomycetaceae bacterium]